MTDSSSSPSRPPRQPTPPDGTAAAGYLIDVRWGVAHDLHRVCTGIGRDASNPIVIRDLAASRSHAEIQRDANRFVLHPLGSAETRVNGLPVVQPRPLAEGDVIEIAFTRFRFTRTTPEGDVVPAPARVAVDAELAGQKTETREIVPRGEVRRRRGKLRDHPVELHWWILLAAILAGALALALVIRLAIRFI